MTSMLPSWFDGKKEKGSPHSRSLPVKEISISKIDADPTWNSRSGDLDVADLAKNIDAVGLMQPIVVTPTLDSVGTSRYQIVAGFRRFAAVQKLGWTKVQATIVEVDREQAQLDNLAENLSRKNLRLYDTMRVVHELSDKRGLKNSRLARDIGIKESRVAMMVRVWPRLSPGLKEKWSKIPSAEWEPTMHQLTQWSLLSYSEQNAEWSKWSNDQDSPGTEFDAEGNDRYKKNRRRARYRRNTKAVRNMITKLTDENTDESNAQIRALEWVLGTRGSL